MGNFFCSIFYAASMALLPAWSLAPVPPGHTRRPMSGPAILTWNCMLSGGCGGTRRVDGRELAENSDPPRVIRRGDWTPTRRYPVDARTKLDRRGVKVARGTASASALSSPSSPAPAVKQPAAPEQLPALRAQPVGHHVERTRCDHHHGQHGTASINQALGRGSRRALRAPSRGAGRHAAPSPGPRRLDGVLVVRSCDRAVAAAATPSPENGAHLHAIDATSSS